jgi:hypothetical protein
MSASNVDYYLHEHTVEKLTKQAAAAAVASSTGCVAKCDSERMPVAKAILETLSEGALRTLSGNGMHLHAAGAVLAWTLGNAVPATAQSCQLEPALAALFFPSDKGLKNFPLPTWQPPQPERMCPDRAFQIGCKPKKKTAVP